MWRPSIAAVAISLLVLASTAPVSAQADLAEMDDEALATVESYFREIEAMQRPLFEYADAHPGATPLDPVFAAGFTPLLEDASERVGKIVPPECLARVHEQLLLDTQHRLDGWAAVQAGDLEVAEEHLKLAKDAENAGLEALDSAICKNARPATELEQGARAMSLDEYESDYTIAQDVFSIMITQDLSRYNAAKNRTQRLKALENLWGTTEYHLTYLTGINPAACFADLHTEQVEALREVSHELASNLFSGERVEARLDKNEADQLSRAINAFDPDACDPARDSTIMSDDEWVAWVEYSGVVLDFHADTSVSLAKYANAKSRTQIINALRRRVADASSHLGYLADVNPHTCFADVHNEHLEAIRGFYKYSKRALEAARTGKVQALIKNFEKAYGYDASSLASFDFSSCESVRPASMGG